MNSVPEAFVETGVRLSLLLFGWGALIFMIICVVMLVINALHDSEFLWIFGMVAGMCAIVLGIIWMVDLFPYNGKYQHYYSVQGKVEKVSNVLSDASGDFTRTPVITLDSVDRPLVIPDPRAVALQNSEVTLRCTIDWNYQAADTYECKIVNY